MPVCQHDVAWCAERTTCRLTATAKPAASRKLNWSASYPQLSRWLCRTRNPGGNPSSSWAGLFTFSGGELTTGPNGNGVGKQLSATQWSFVPTDPAQVRCRRGW